jgi:hypothetical protein
MLFSNAPSPPRRNGQPLAVPVMPVTLIFPNVPLRRPHAPLAELAAVATEHRRVAPSLCQRASRTGKGVLRHWPAECAPTAIHRRLGLERIWLWCVRCQHHSPFACAVVVIRLGAAAPSDVQRERVRCRACGNEGATLQHPN